MIAATRPARASTTVRKQGRDIVGHLYQRGSVWWFQFYQDGQRVRMTSESTDKDVAKRMLREHEARVTLKEPLVARSARVTYEELRGDLLEHYSATGGRDVAEAGYRLI